jgi:hypothetical protein
MSIDTVALIVGGAPEKAEVQGEGAAYQIVDNSNDDNLGDDLEEFELLPLPISQRPHPLWQWLKLTIIVLILLALAAVMLRWGVPFLLDKVSSAYTSLSFFDYYSFLLTYHLLLSCS